MLSDMVPFRMVGNLYFVGTRAASSHMIDTGDGLILTPDMITQPMRFFNRLNILDLILLI